MVAAVGRGGVSRESTVGTHGFGEQRTRREPRSRFDRRSGHDRRRYAGLSVETPPRQTMDLRAGADRRKQGG